MTFPRRFQNPIVAAEQRPTVAHGETVGFRPPTNQAPERGERNVLPACFLPLLTELNFSTAKNPRLHRGLLSSRLRRSRRQFWIPERAGQKLEREIQSQRLNETGCKTRRPLLIRNTTHQSSMISTISETPPYRVQFTDGRHSALADTTQDKGGRESGFRPHELLKAALAACMNMAATMYAAKHAIPLTQVITKVTLAPFSFGAGCFPLFRRVERRPGCRAETSLSCRPCVSVLFARH